jgi:proline dehydrogenase
MRIRTAAGGAATRVLRTGLLWASRQKLLGRVASKAPLARTLVSRFVAGEELGQAIPVIEALEKAGFRTTVDVLGELVTNVDDARRAVGEYLELLRALEAAGRDRNISIKLTQLGLALGYETCERNLEDVVGAASAIGAFVRIDMEDSPHTDATLALARSVRSRYHDVGVVTQAYLRRSPADIENLIREQVRVRLCKGAYAEPPSVALVSKAEVDAQYARLAERLLRDGHYPALATHDPRLIEAARAYADRIGRGRDTFEFQMLYGIRRDLQRALVDAGYRLRVYVPYGANWYAYFMRRLAERPANLAFVAKNLWKDGR